MDSGGDIKDILFTKCKFGRFNGITMPNTANPGGNFTANTGTKNIRFINCEFDNTDFDRNTFGTTMAGTNISIDGYNGYAGSKYMWSNGCYMKVDTANSHDASGSGIRLESNQQTTGYYGYHTVGVPVDTTGSATISMYWKKNAANGSYFPFARAYNNRGDIASAIFTTADTNWNNSTIVIPCTAKEVLDLQIHVARDAGSFIYFDDVTVIVS
jgi:hypothetical protein